MKKFFEKFPRETLGKMVVVLILILLTTSYTIPWIVRNSLEKDYSGVDFHGYWYAGHYIRQGVNSYAAILNTPNPTYWDPRIPGSGDPRWPVMAEYSLKLPIYYLDGPVVREYPVARTLIVVPAITAPLNLLIGLFSWFSWPSARLIWMVLNLTFAAIIPWLAIRLIDKHQTLSLVDKLLFALIFYNIYGVRQGVVVGQQSLICLLLLVSALLLKDKWMISGILLGLGISKYSVGLPIFVYFLLRKEYRIAMVGILVQIIGVMLLIPFKWGSLMDTMLAYYKVIDVNYSQDGVHLLARFSDIRIKAVLFLIVLSITLFLLARQYFYRRASKLEGNMEGLNDLALLTLAIYLITYHRVHDMPFVIFFLLLLISSMIEARKFSFNPPLLIIFFLTAIGIIALLLFPTLPGNIAAYVGIIQSIPKTWNSAEAASSISLIIMFAISIWLRLNLLSSPTVPVKTATN